MGTSRQLFAVLTSVFTFWLLPAPCNSQDGRPTDVEQQVANEKITEASIRADVQFLADDLLEGRGPGTNGDLLGQRYIISQFQLAGLQPAAADGGWVQNVSMIGVTTHPPESLTFKTKTDSVDLANSTDYIVTCGNAVEDAKFADAEIVFVGYGIQAPEFDWDDFKDVDVSGKILLVMNNDPSTDEDLFGGRTRLYYGRWDYKFAKVAEMGALGALIIHTDESAGYPYQVVQTSWTGEQMALGGAQEGRALLEGWLTEDASKRLAQLAGMDLDELRTAAESRDFRPVSLGVSLSAEIPCRVRERTTGNVLGLLPGSDPKLSKQWIVFTAHHDHLGMSETRDERGDNIYNGAVDNASGVASMLAIARGMASLQESDRPKRSILFASVGAEEQGLLGSEFLARNPPIPAGRLAATINIDGINILGPTTDVVVIGRGKSDLDQIVERNAVLQNRVVVGDPFPDHGYYYRSDQFSLAKVGVPGVYLGAGVNVVGKPDGWGMQKQREWTDNIYHQTSDEYNPEWDLSGAVEDARLLFHIGMQVANQSAIPAWKPGDEFEAARIEALKGANK